MAALGARRNVSAFKKIAHKKQPSKKSHLIDVFWHSFFYSIKNIGEHALFCLLYYLVVVV